MTYRRGDVVLACWPNSDMTLGKPRPALVAQADSLQTGLSQLVVAMVSSNTGRAGRPFRVLIPLASPLSRGSGLRADSVVMADNLGTLHLREVNRRIGCLADMTPIDAALRVTLGL